MDTRTCGAHGVRHHLNEERTVFREALPDSRQTQAIIGVKNPKFGAGSIKGFPLSRKGNGVKWCQDLKTQSVFSGAPHKARRQKNCGIHRHRSGRAQKARTAQREKTGTIGGVWHWRRSLWSVLSVRRMPVTNLRNRNAGWLLVLPQPRCRAASTFAEEFPRTMGVADEVGSGQPG